MKTIFSYQTDIIKLSDNRNYHAVVTTTKTDKGLESKIILESDYSKDEVLIGTYFSSTYDYAECCSHVYSMLNDFSYLDYLWKIFVENKTTGGSYGKSACKKRCSHN